MLDHYLIDEVKETGACFTRTQVLPKVGIKALTVKSNKNRHVPA